MFKHTSDLIRVKPYSAGIDFSRHVFRRQILTTKVDPRTVKVKNIYNGRRPTT